MKGVWFRMATPKQHPQQTPPISDNCGFFSAVLKLVSDRHAKMIGGIKSTWNSAGVVHKEVAFEHDHTPIPMYIPCGKTSHTTSPHVHTSYAVHCCSRNAPLPCATGCTTQFSSPASLLSPCIAVKTSRSPLDSSWPRQYSSPLQPILLPLASFFTTTLQPGFDLSGTKKTCNKNCCSTCCYICCTHICKHMASKNVYDHRPCVPGMPCTGVYMVCCCSGA